MAKVIVKDYSLWLNLLKAGTYTIVGFIATYSVEAIQGGASLKNGLIIGIAIGVIAGIKNFVKHSWNLDLDLTRIKK